MTKPTYKTSITKSRAGHYTVSILTASKLNGLFYSVKKKNLISDIYKARIIAKEMLADLSVAQ